ncbi:hypothetical protein [Pseudonocardia pini]|uniref:hypothetical protein n=1 Tax=Pseudonocardia pini TaxID=2758030 RepID=UPI0015F09F93|nr:hypothetical protein [Pseudonocardia pini]
MTAAVRELLPCGTDAAYQRHVRAGDLACDPCLDAHRVAVGARRPPPTRIYRSRDEILEEWDRHRGLVRFVDFHTRVGITAAAWRRAFYRAQAEGDRRARKAATDHPGFPARRAA